MITRMLSAFLLLTGLTAILAAEAKATNPLPLVPSNPSLDTSFGDEGWLVNPFPGYGNITGLTTVNPSSSVQKTLGLISKGLRLF